MKVVEYYVLPGKYTHEEKHTIYKALLPNGVKLTYINMGDAKDPDWIHMSDFFETIYKNKYHDSSIMEPLIHIYYQNRDTK